eukprot:100192-Chlamydomonas_euryale.AAC.3
MLFQDGMPACAVDVSVAVVLVVMVWWYSGAIGSHTLVKEAYLASQEKHQCTSIMSMQDATLVIVTSGRRGGWHLELLIRLCWCTSAPSPPSPWLDLPACKCATQGGLPHTHLPANAQPKAACPTPTCPQLEEFVMSLFERFVDPLLEHVRKHCRSAVLSCDINLVSPKLQAVCRKREVAVSERRPLLTSPLNHQEGGREGLWWPLKPRLTSLRTTTSLRETLPAWACGRCDFCAPV